MYIASSDHHMWDVIFILIFIWVETEAKRSSFFSKAMQSVCGQANVRHNHRPLTPPGLLLCPRAAWCPSTFCLILGVWKRYPFSLICSADISFCFLAIMPTSEWWVFQCIWKYWFPVSPHPKDPTTHPFLFASLGLTAPSHRGLLVCPRSADRHTCRASLKLPGLRRQENSWVSEMGEDFAIFKVKNSLLYTWRNACIYIISCKSIH